MWCKTYQPKILHKAKILFIYLICVFIDHTFRDGCLFCEKDYQEKFLSLCYKCKEFITEVSQVHVKCVFVLSPVYLQACVEAMDQTWHPEHFQCYGCLVIFTDNMAYREKVLNFIIPDNDVPVRICPKSTVKINPGFYIVLSQ